MSQTDYIQSKIISREHVPALISRWKLESKTIVFTNGCFDLLHFGHIDYLSKARDMGDVLIIGLNTDKSTSALKGPHRPLNDERSRAAILASLFFVSAVVLFDEPTPEALIRVVQPDVLVKGGDYAVEQVVGHDFVASYGGKTAIIEFVPGYSTTNIEKKILGQGKS